MLVADEIAFLLRDSGARIALVADDLEAVVARGAADAGVEVLLLGAERALATAADGASLRRAAREPLDPAVLFYTSGTTGRPKGAVLTHFNLAERVTIFTANLPQPRRRHVRLSAAVPHFGQTVALNATFRVGGTLILPAALRPGRRSRYGRHAVTAFLGVPTCTRALAAGVRGRGPRCRGCAWASRAARRCPVASSRSSTTHLRHSHPGGLRAVGDLAARRASTSRESASSRGHRPPDLGRGGRDRRPRGRRPHRAPGRRRAGEIVIRGHDVFAGYHERPEATAAAIVDGWFRSGDLGTKDARGFLRIVDRKKDLILRGGYNVYPREVEEVLVRHPDVDQAAVVGVPHETHGEEVLAVVVAREGAGTARPTRRRCWPGSGERWRATSARGWCATSTSCRSAPAARCSSASCATVSPRRVGVGVLFAVLTVRPRRCSTVWRSSSAVCRCSMNGHASGIWPWSATMPKSRWSR